MTAQASIITSSEPSAIAVPIQSVVERTPPGQAKGADTTTDDTAAKKKYVFVVRNGVAKMTEVTTGISNATHVVIRSGLKLGDSIVTGPFRTLKSLKDGAKVQPTKEEAPKETTT
jgi:HlyD family secretion protein